jgi:hypothetical protein
VPPESKIFLAKTLLLVMWKLSSSRSVRAYRTLCLPDLNLVGRQIPGQARATLGVINQKRRCRDINPLGWGAAAAFLWHGQQV